ncbi:MAG: GNAT family N-acetyltransferase [Steroidobacteraceae bacterium]
METSLPLTTARLALRRPEPSDAEFILRLVNDPDWLRYIGDRGVRTLEEASAFIDERLLGSFHQHGFGLWVVEPRAGGAALGLCGLLKRDELEHVDVGYAFLPEARQRGYALEAARCAVAFATATLGMRHLVAIVQPANEPSRRVLEKLGMRLQGMIAFNGRETCLYGLDAAAPPA